MCYVQWQPSFPLSTKSKAGLVQVKEPGSAGLECKVYVSEVNERPCDVHRDRDECVRVRVCVGV